MATIAAVSVAVAGYRGRVPTGTLWIDVTSAMTFPGPRLSGIPRVELEIAAGLARSARVEFVRFDETRGVVRTVPVGELASRRRFLASDDTAAAHAARRAGGRRVVARLVHVLTRRSPHPDRFTELATASARHAGGLVTDLVALGREIGRLVIRRGVRRRGTVQAAWGPGDVYLCLGLPRSAAIVDAVDAIAVSRGVSIVRFVYDLTPVIMPQFTTYGAESQRLLFRSSFGSASRLIAISRSTAADIGAFCAVEQMPCPPIEVVPPASAVLDGTERRPVLPDAVTDFILCVGTVEPRKNHHLLLDVWQDLVRTGSAPIPYLVIAGSVGWSNDETMNRIRHTPELADHLWFVESPSDAELRWLYRHCLFTVYPSLYEGWGLPVSESLSAGKMCVTSDRASLPEAGQGLTIELDATDRRLWRETIVDLTLDRDRLTQHEDRIRREYRPRAVRDVVGDVLRAVDHEIR